MSYGKADLSSLLRTDAECLRLIHAEHFPKDLWLKDAVFHVDQAAVELDSCNQHLREADKLLQEISESTPWGADSSFYRDIRRWRRLLLEKGTDPVGQQEKK